jgi:hypothetical protein
MANQEEFISLMTGGKAHILPTEKGRQIAFVTRKADLAITLVLFAALAFPHQQVNIAPQTDGPAGISLEKVPDLENIRPQLAKALRASGREEEANQVYPDTQDRTMQQ